MQFTKLISVAFFAAMASAHVHHPQHFHHRRQLANSTGSSTTLTVFATNTRTVTKCPASVTNCPARGTGGMVVITETKQVAVTVCPVEQAASLSSAIASSYAASATPLAQNASPASLPSGGELTTTAPFVPVGSGSGPVPSRDTVLTYTLGAGTSTTVVTTTIKHVLTATITSTLPAGYAGGVDSESEEKTTTYTGTSTTTRTITIAAVPTADTSGASGNGAANCAPPVTVTVALSVSTVTVTETASPTTAAPTAAASGEEEDDSNNDAEDIPSPSNQSEGNTPNNVAAVPYPAGGSKGALPSDAVVIVSTATVVPLPQQTKTTLQPGGPPYGNGTYPGQPGASSLGAAHATTFITKANIQLSTSSAPMPAAPTGYPTY